MNKDGKQTIDCTVKNCRHNTGGKHCDLSRIQIEADKIHSDSKSGEPADESLCGSFRCKQ